MLVKFVLGIWPDWEFNVFVNLLSFKALNYFLFYFFVFHKFYSIKKFCLSVYKNKLSVICYFANPLTFVIYYFFFIFFFVCCFYGVLLFSFFSFFFFLSCVCWNFFCYLLCVFFPFVIFEFTVRDICVVNLLVKFS